MFINKLIDSLEHFARVLPVTVEGIPQEDLRWKPESGNWSIQEVVCHLADEEEADFPRRIQMTLEDPSQPWPPIDPEAWARERGYNTRDFQQELDRFLFHRQRTVDWLKNVDNPDWNLTYQHPAGDLRAGDLLAAWTAHDWLHLRQIAKRMYEISRRDAEPFDAKYAGEWNA